MLKNYIAIVLDRSLSMNIVKDVTIKAFNDQVAKIREETKGQETVLSLVTFSDPNDVQKDVWLKPVDQVASLNRDTYRPYGNTALFDAVGVTVDGLRHLPDANDPNVSFLVITMTDGEENRSLLYNEYSIRDLMRETQATDRWTYAFLLPPGYGNRFAASFGVPKGNIREWENTREGTQVASAETEKGVEKYFAARRAGQTQVAAFYHTTDLSPVDRATIQRNLKDLSHFFKVYEVPKEVRIDEFLTEKTKRPYVVGAGYYQLMKKELVQTHKKILIMEKGQKAIWGGDESRKLIGLPEGADSKVTPGNHANYDIFVQSKAPNRKLPRGTRVIFDPSHSHESDPTWDFATAYAEAEKKRQASETV